MWPRKRKQSVVTDVEDARTMRETAHRDIADLTSQTPHVQRIAARLVERRALNHFGDDIQITFTQRERRA